MSVFAWLTLAHFAMLILLCYLQWVRVAKIGSEAQGFLILRWSKNIPLGLFNRGLSLAVAAVIGIPSAIRLAETFHWNFLGQRPLFGFLAFMLIMDFLFYLRHRFYHLLLWNFHRLHHEDEAFDATLSLRFHPVEIVINIAVYAIGALVCGASEMQAALASQLFAFQALISHLDVKPPTGKMWKFLESIVIFPWTHETHHERRRPHCNFGFLFSFWDRILGTWQARSVDRAQLGVGD